MVSATCTMARAPSAGPRRASSRHWLWARVRPSRCHEWRHESAVFMMGFEADPLGFWLLGSEADDAHDARQRPSCWCTDCQVAWSAAGFPRYNGFQRLACFDRTMRTSMSLTLLVVASPRQHAGGHGGAEHAAEVPAHRRQAHRRAHRPARPLRHEHAGERHRSPVKG